MPLHNIKHRDLRLPAAEQGVDNVAAEEAASADDEV
jgi:hypothetical protein